MFMNQTEMLRGMKSCEIKKRQRSLRGSTTCQLRINPTITLLLVGGIDILVNVFISLKQVLPKAVLDASNKCLHVANMSPTDSH